MIVRARHVVTMDGAPIENGAVVVAGDRIAKVGRWPEVNDGNTGKVIDLGDSALLPGLINAHCHLDYTSLRRTIPPPASFPEWIEAINARKASLTPDDYLQSIAAGFAEAAEFGTTTLANLEAFPELLARIGTPPLRTWWFAELIDIRAPQPAAATYENMRGSFECGGTWLGGLGLAPHAPYTASAALYEEVAMTARTHNLPVTTHLSESREEMEMFRERSGPLFALMQRLGRPLEDCGTATPLGLLLSRKVLDERWIIAHLNELTKGDLAQLASSRKFHVVHCPRSHRYFGHAPFKLRKLRALGYNICVGTDSLASNEDLSLFAELRQLADVEPTLSARELLEMVTINAAAALGQANALGRIREAFAADLIALPRSSNTTNLLETLLEFGGKVAWMMIAGRVVGGAR